MSKISMLKTMSRDDAEITRATQKLLDKHFPKVGENAQLTTIMKTVLSYWDAVNAALPEHLCVPACVPACAPASEKTITVHSIETRGRKRMLRGDSELFVVGMSFYRHASFHRMPSTPSSHDGCLGLTEDGMTS